jgi:ketosteroid isomerase-like protein
MYVRAALQVEGWPMSAVENKKIATTIWNAFSAGDSRPFVDAMADDFVWRHMFPTNWRHAYEGKKCIIEEFFPACVAQFSSRYKSNAARIIADDDHVIVECSNEVMMKSGEQFVGNRCYVIDMQNGKMRELREYFDTELSNRMLVPPTA